MCIPSPRRRGEGRDDLVVGAARRQPKVRGLVRNAPLPGRPPHPRSAHHKHDEVLVILSPQAGRGGPPLWLARRHPQIRRREVQ
ncbi:hypothetical protein FV220_16060 [Methylobacterium sp. WL19]|nr:hypothetical protein FV220_16060 [Methylobacterium sp. WL19]